MFSEGGRKDDVNDEDEDSDLFDSDYDISTEVEDDDILFDDYVDDKTTSDLEVDDENNSDGLSGSSDDGETDIMGDEIDLNENKVSDDEQSESSYPIFNPAEKFDPTFTLGMMFSTKGELRNAIQSHAIKTRRHIICTKSDPSRYYAKCGDTNCDWRLHARKVKDECTFQIRDYNPKHKCAKTFNLKNVKSSWLCDKYLDKFKSDPKRLDVISPKIKAYRAKRKALEKLEGSPEYQYTRLWDYADEIRRTNPGSTVIVGTEDVGGENRFSKFYVCFSAMKIGFKEGCRKIIGVDGCHLKGPHGGILLTGSRGGSKQQSLPNCICCCKHRIKGNLGVSEYVFMSDKQKGLIQAFQEVLPAAPHRFCVRHMHSNFKNAGFRGLAFKHALWRAAKACNKGEFKARMRDIQVLDQTAFDWFSDKPPEQWSGSHFSPNVKCDMLLNNCCETFNMMILDAREKPILTMLEWIREFLMKRLQENRDMAEAKWKDRICPRIRKILDKHIEKVGDCIPIKADNFHYQISCFDGGQYAVDLSNHTCSCRKWELSGIPCKHAISAILNQKDDPEDYIDDCYSWNETCFIPPLPPRFGRRSGRPSSARRRDADEPMPKKKKGKKGNGMKLKRQQTTVKCSKCGQEKHNARTCPKTDLSQWYEEITDLTVEDNVLTADEALPTKLNVRKRGRISTQQSQNKVVADKGKNKVTDEAPIILAPITGKGKGKKKVTNEAEVMQVDNEVEIILPPITGKGKGKEKVTNESEMTQVDNEAEIILPPITSLVTSQSAENENEIFTTLQVPNLVSNSPQYTKGPSMYTQLQSVGLPMSATSRVNIRAPPPMLGSQYSVTQHPVQEHFPVIMQGGKKFITLSNLHSLSSKGPPRSSSNNS
ncbi:UNVERIFIED_CONTAM: hypothetical protein Sindi_2442700 [Sesamum indicum]